jgi:hypothetical protein
VEDIVWTSVSYHEVYAASGLEAVARYAPLARGDEPYAWISETRVAPWHIYVLKRMDPGDGTDPGRHALEGGAA